MKPHPVPALRATTNQSFTLIELLVVIAIISVLASMLLPVLGQARKKAKTAACQSQLKQVGMAMLMYTDDNDGWFTNHKYNNARWAMDLAGNIDGLFPEYGDKTVTGCPTLPHSKTWKYMSMSIVAGDSPFFTVGVYNRVSVRRLGLYEALNYPKCPGDPTKRVLGGDLMHGYDGSLNYLSIQSDFGGQASAGHEGKGSSTIFEDGHVEWFDNPLGHINYSYAEWNTYMWFGSGRGPYFSYHWCQQPNVAFTR